LRAQLVVGLLPTRAFSSARSSFAYTRYNGAWLVFDQKADGNWVQRQVVNKFGRDDYLYNLMAISPHMVAWEQENEVWTHDLTTGAEAKIWAATNTLYGFTYDDDTGDFLLNCSDENGPLSICFRPPRVWDKQGAVLSVTRNDNREKYADLSEDHGLYSFAIKSSTNSEPTHFIWEGMVEYYKLAGDYLYFTGNLANGPPGIWQYNIKSKEVRCLDSALKANFKYTTMVTPEDGMGTNAGGKQINYHIWAPIHVSPGKKYPLIIGQTHYMWCSYQQVAANGGYYFASADRLSWWDGLNDWGRM
jgi:dipeptidyl aminopeptidase/acylaminoacyl peptidase